MDFQESDKPKVVFLNGDNWRAYKLSIRCRLDRLDVWDVVTGKETRPVGANADEVKGFLKKQRIARDTLVNSISQTFYYLIEEKEAPDEIWQALVDHFEQGNSQNKYLLLQQLWDLRMKDDETPDTLAMRLKELVHQLAALKMNLDVELQILALIRALSNKYQPFRQAWLSNNPNANNFSKALEAVKSFDLSLRMDEDGQGRKGQEKAEKALKAGGKKKTSLSKLKCFGCGKEGHMKRDCRNKEKNEKTDKKHKASTAKEQADEESDMESFHQSGAFTAKICRGKDHRWLLDSGATKHMTFQRELLQDYVAFSKPQKVMLGNDSMVEAHGSGTVKLRLRLKNGKEFEIPMLEVLFVPGMAVNLFSVKSAAKRGNWVEFGHNKYCIRNASGQVLAEAREEGDLYYLQCKPIVPDQSFHAAKAIAEDGDKWHKRLGHISPEQIRKMAEQKLVKGLSLTPSFQVNFCEPCVIGKMHRKSHKAVGEIKSKGILDLVHSDLCGPMQTESIGGRKYFITFIDDYSRYTKVYFLRHKSEAFEKFKEFEAMVARQTGSRIKVLRTDGGREYLSNEFKSYLKGKGIVHQTTVAYTPQQNGVAERMNRTLVESARAMIANADLGRKYWAEAINTAAYVRNRVPTSSLGNITPYERWYGRKPSVAHLKVFGCIAYAHVPDEQRKKLDGKAVKLRFVGYSGEQKGYRLLDDASDRLEIKYDVVFNEDDFGKSGNEAKEPQQWISLHHGGDGDDAEHQEQTETEESGRRYPVRQRKQPNRLQYEKNGLQFDDDGETQVSCHAAHSAVCVQEPETMEEALASEHRQEWKKAADEEYGSLMENDTWTLVKLPGGRKPISCKWVFKVKHDKNGQVEKFKARLVAKGFSQKYGIDYDETFAPVVKFSSIRALLAFGIQHGMLIHQMDVVTAFLYGHLNEEIYMEQPPGYVKSNKRDLVCKLNKSLYGLKQSPRCWNETISNYLESCGFVACQADPCVFIRKKKEIAIVAVYVDDLIIMTRDSHDLKMVKENLAVRFKMKDLGELHYCLGINIKIDEQRRWIQLSQKQYIMKLLQKYGLETAKPVSTPVDPNVKLVKDDGVSKPVDQRRYQSMVGSILYAATATRPDISYAVGVVSKFNAAPTQQHMTAVKRILRYLKGTLDICLQYSKDGDGDIVGYSDADWGNDESRYSTSGIAFLLGNGAISWQSQKQGTIALSTVEAEYVALSGATQEAIWLRRLMRDLSTSVEKPTVIMEDNQGAIALAGNPIGHKRTKHIDIRYHFIREKVQDGTIVLEYCPTKEMVADILTKALPRERFEVLRRGLGLKMDPEMEN